MPARTRVIAGMLAAALLGGCNPLSSFAPTETEILTSAFTPRDRLPAGPPVYCYSTLGEVDCYRSQQPAEAHRLVASDPPIESW